MKIKPKIWKAKIDPNYYEIFIEESVNSYEDSKSSCLEFSVFRAEDDNRIIGIGFRIEDLQDWSRL